MLLAFSRLPSLLLYPHNMWSCSANHCSRLRHERNFKTNSSHLQGLPSGRTGTKGLGPSTNGYWSLWRNSSIPMDSQRALLFHSSTLTLTPKLLYTSLGNSENTKFGDFQPKPTKKRPHTTTNHLARPSLTGRAECRTLTGASLMSSFKSLACGWRSPRQKVLIDSWNIETVGLGRRDNQKQ